MRKIVKKAIALVAVAAMTMTTIVGCSVKDSEVVLTVGKTEVTADMAKFYGRYLQPQFESYMLAMLNSQYQQLYGTSLNMEELDWDMEYQEGVTYEDFFKENYVLGALKSMYLAQENMGEYNVELTEEELAEIEEAAKAFDSANDEKTKDKVSANKELVIQYLKLVAISEKVNAAILETVDREVAEEDAAQKRLRYVSFAKTKTDDTGAAVELTEDEIAALKTEAETFLAGAKDNGSLETYAKEKEKTATAENFGKDYKDDTALVLDDKTYETAHALTSVGFLDLVETDDAFYVVEVESLLDTEATEAEKESIISNRESEKVTEVFEAWEESSKVKVNEKAWDRLKFGTIKVTQKAEEQEETTDDDASTDATETTEDTTTEDDASTETDATEETEE